MKKQVLTVYVCDHCGKISRSAGALTLHERCCKKNPAMRPLCYGCKFFESSADTENVPCYYGDPWEGETITFTLTPNRCIKKGCKLYNGLRWRKERLTQIKTNLYQYAPMPSVADGCEHFKKGTPQQPAVPFDNPVNVSIPEPL